MTENALDAGNRAVHQIVPAFDSAAVAVLAGNGIVVRFPGVLGVIGVAADDPALSRFLGICSDVSAAGSRAPGRRLARALAVWLADVEEPPTLGTISATDGGVGIFLVGAATARLEGSATTLSGADAGAWFDRVVDWPPANVALSLDGTAIDFDLSVFDLKLGVVRGRGAVLGAQSTPSVPTPEESAAAIDIPQSAPVATPEPPAPVAADAVVARPATPPAAAPADPPVSTPPKRPMQAPLRSARIDIADEPPRAPLPVVEAPPRAPIPPPPPPPGHAPPAAPQTTPEAAAPGEAQVRGFLCSRGHLNDPRALFCGLCGIRMAERTGVLTIGRRPPLGLLVFDDGSTFTVDSPYLLGRDPDSDNRVRDGSIRPLVVIDPSGAVSRRHAEIRLDGWTVVLVDVGSANGTFIAPRGVDQWSAMVPQRPIALLAGTRIRMGDRTLVFESPHGAP